MKNEIICGYVEDISGGSADAVGGVNHNLVHVRSSEGSLTTIRYLYVSQEIDFLLRRSIELGEPVEIWAKVDSFEKGSSAYAIRTPTRSVYAPNIVARHWKLQGWKAFLTSFGFLATIPTIVLAPLALLTPILWIVAIYFFVRSASWAPLSQEVFDAGRDVAIARYPGFFPSKQTAASVSA